MKASSVLNIKRSMFQMTESGSEASLTSQFLQSCLSVLPARGPPQLRLQTNTSLARLSPPGRNFNEKNTEPPLCSHCYTPVDLQRANIRLEKLRKTVTLHFHCHVCRREMSQEEIIFSRLDPQRETKTRCEEDQNRQKAKKKKCKKEKNAGLTIPTVSPTVKMKTVNSQNKLKHLLATDRSSNKSSLQDFLKKL